LREAKRTARELISRKKVESLTEGDNWDKLSSDLRDLLLVNALKHSGADRLFLKSVSSQI
jgi:hypothetical protein